MLTCQSVVELVTDYLEGNLPTHERLALEAHLAGCAGCSTYVDQMRQTVAAVRTVGPDLPVASSEELVAEFLAVRRGSRGTQP